MKVEYINEISIDDYNYLRKSAGWKEVSKRKAKIGIENSVFIVVATIDKKPIGMARIVGDGGYFVLIVDVVVLPQWQKNGIGKNLMKQIMAYINQDTFEKESVFVSLIAAPNREPFYEPFGFKLCPNSDSMGTGMYQYICKL